MGGVCCCQSDESEKEKERRRRGERRDRENRRDTDRRTDRTDDEGGEEIDAASKQSELQVKMYVALYDYRASSPAELTMCKGDRVEMLSNEQGFAFVRQAKAEGARGFVQADYLMEEKKASRSSPSTKPPPAKRQLPPELSEQWREIPRDELKLAKMLGEGRFGEVHMAKWTRADGTTSTVVTKQLKNITSQDRKALLDEAATMKGLDHPNVVKLHGVVSVTEPNYLVSEFVKDGSLQDYLKKRRKQLRLPQLPAPALINICRQIASGMDYLTKKRLVHRDLASRNVLIDVTSETPFVATAKVADFGLTRTMNKEYQYRMKRETYIATKWLAPEAFDDTVFSVYTDIWAFGVMMAEIFKDGEDPWNDMKEEDMVRVIMTGRGPEKPPSMPSAVYSIMTKCCQKDPKSRPRFGQLAKEFESLK